tara:strand:+ start:82 stop:537 length:456 start_codon:yes stop_codon:yes gene_type:complete
MEKTESILTLTNLVMGAGGTGGLGFLFKFFYNSIKEGFDSIRLSSKKQFDEIKQDLVSQKTDITNLSDKFTNFNLIIQKIDITLTSVEKDLDKANENLSETRKLALNNEKAIGDNAHRIGNVESNLMLVEELITKINNIERNIIVLESRKK